MTGPTARRRSNHATGYPYTKYDHFQMWTMPDGSTEGTGWIDRGDTDVADKVIANFEKEQARIAGEIVKWKSIRAGLEAEKGIES